MTRLETLADAIKQYEGWFFGSRSWRNNNPGNLRSSQFQSGQAGGFATFSSYASGWLALWYDLLCKCVGRTRTRLTPESSLYDLISVWAPNEDGNNSLAYTMFVAKKCGVSPDTKLKWFVEDIF